MKKCFLLLLIATLPILAFAKPTNKSNVLHFKNQRGSTLNITMTAESNASGTVTGTFATAVANKNCQEVIGKPRPVTGFYTGNAISLSVNFPRCGAAIAIIGNFDRKGNIKVLWIDAHQGLKTNKQNWNTRTIGYDKYNRLKYSSITRPQATKIIS